MRDRQEGASAIIAGVDRVSQPFESTADKPQLRAAALARRAALDPQARIEAALAIAEWAGDLAIPAGAVVSGFFPIRNEIDPRPLMAALRERGHRLCLPVVNDPYLVFRELVRGGDLVPAGFGTFAPGREAEECVPDAMLVPFAAFDRRGHRIGYGKGHYDRAISTIAATKPLRLIGVGFSVQEVPVVPSQAHDRALDMVASEIELIDFTNKD